MLWKLDDQFQWTLLRPILDFFFFFYVHVIIFSRKM